MHAKRDLPALVCCTLLLASVLQPAPLRASTQTRTQKPQATNASAQSGEDKFERGKRLYQQGDASAAIPLLRDATKSRKKDADAWHYYGLALSRAGHAKDARKAFEKALKLQPNDAGARTGLAYSFLLLGKSHDAEREARRARD